MEINRLLEIAKQAALAAGKEIMRIYDMPYVFVEAKADHSPLTMADKAAHRIIQKCLERANLPIISEEGRTIPFEKRINWEYFWMVDPLDGTKEFIKKNGEFTVNIALIHQTEPVLGVVHPPAQGNLYFAWKGQGAFLEHDGKKTQLFTSKRAITEPELKVVASRSHRNKKTEEYLTTLTSPVVISKGSSLKFLLVAAGQADIYPRFSPTMEWDTAAAHVIVNEAGGSIILTDKQTTLNYNKENLLNPNFLVLPYR